LVIPVGQVAWHLPDPQVGETPPQAVLHAPQFFGSVSVSMHVPLQSVVPVGQPQAPFTHALPPVQVMPQVPQFLGSDFLSTQALAQFSSGAAHTVAQVPSEQTWPVVQAPPHVPQF
jgi:hypothetical protein